MFDLIPFGVALEDSPAILMKRFNGRLIMNEDTLVSDRRATAAPSAPVLATLARHPHHECDPPPDARMDPVSVAFVNNLAAQPV